MNSIFCFYVESKRDVSRIKLSEIEKIVNDFKFKYEEKSQKLIENINSEYKENNSDSLNLIQESGGGFEPEKQKNTICKTFLNLFPIGENVEDQFNINKEKHKANSISFKVYSFSEGKIKIDQRFFAYIKKFLPDLFYIKEFLPDDWDLIFNYLIKGQNIGYNEDQCNKGAIENIKAMINTAKSKKSNIFIYILSNFYEDYKQKYLAPEEQNQDKIDDQNIENMNDAIVNLEDIIDFSTKNITFGSNELDFFKELILKRIFYPEECQSIIDFYKNNSHKFFDEINNPYELINFLQINEQGVEVKIKDPSYGFSYIKFTEKGVKYSLEPVLKIKNLEINNLKTKIKAGAVRTGGFSIDKDGFLSNGEKYERWEEFKKIKEENDLYNKDLVYNKRLKQPDQVNNDVGCFCWKKKKNVNQQQGRQLIIK